jgi:ubiquinone/menaquinone biosynthesis C-methylase UbiE
MKKLNKSRTIEVWNKATPWKIGRGFEWTELEPIQRRISKKITGDANRNWISYIVEKYFGNLKPILKCLSLCCGEGGFERELASLSAFSHCDAYDISESQIKKAKKLALEKGFYNIDYEQKDVNSLVLPTNYYDVVFSNSAVHHIKNLEHLFKQIYNSLRPEGLFILNEYIGPSQFQFSERQMEVMNATLRILPLKYRMSRRYFEQVFTNKGHPRGILKRESFFIFYKRIIEKIKSGQFLEAVMRKLKLKINALLKKSHYKTYIQRPTIGEMNINDPSEAIRSAEILPILKDYFEVIEKKEYGGTILQFLLSDIAGNFDPNNCNDMQLLELLFKIEDTLIDCGDLSSDFALIVAKKNNKIIKRNF